MHCPICQKESKNLKNVQKVYEQEESLIKAAFERFHHLDLYEKHSSFAVPVGDIIKIFEVIHKNLNSFEEEHTPLQSKLGGKLEKNTMLTLKGQTPETMRGLGLYQLRLRLARIERYMMI